MKIFIDIGHPAHVHYFKNFIYIMEEKGHTFLITARDKEMSHSLLKSHNISFKNRGKGKLGLLGKFIYMIKADLYIYKLSVKFQPDIFMSFSSPYTAQVSWTLNKPHIAFTDTEHATLGNLAFVPFSNIVVTPQCFKKAFGKKHIRFNGYMELCYLHPNYFTPDPSVLDIMGVKKGEKYVIFRFVSWGASHDVGHSGLNYKTKLQLVEKLSRHTKVFISSEGELPEKLKRYRIQIRPEKMHDALYYASYLFGESGTMTAECAILGTPVVQISGLLKGTIGTLRELEDKYDLVKIYERYDDNILDQIIKNIYDKSFYRELLINNNKMLNDKIDVTAYMVNFVENYYDIKYGYGKD